MNKKILFIFTIFLIIVLAIIFLNDSSLNFVKKNLPNNFKSYIKQKMFNNEQITILNNYNKILYNQQYLPDTQFEDLDFKITKLDFIDDYYQKYQKKIIKKFFMEKIDNDLFINTKKKFYISENFNLKNNKEIPSNLNKFNVSDTLGISRVNKYLFISINEKNSKSECGNLKILYAEINYDFLKFDNFYTFEECLISVVGGRIKEYSFNNENGFLITTGAYGEEDPSLSQEDTSYYGKIVFFGINSRQPVIFSKGHRNPQGLFVGNNIILSTEHGDYGGDEINNIVYGQNYGYPISSYGDTYQFRKKILKERKNYEFLKSHIINNFKEPIFSFVPSIGISQIIMVPSSFSKYWNDNYLVSSLNSRSLYRIKFDLNYEKIFYYEKIFIGERIRDLIFNKKENKIYLALEESGSIGVLSIKDK